jgi:hypothetical protein
MKPQTFRQKPGLLKHLLYALEERIETWVYARMSLQYSSNMFRDKEVVSESYSMTACHGEDFVLAIAVESGPFDSWV